VQEAQLSSCSRNKSRILVESQRAVQSASASRPFDAPMMNIACCIAELLVKARRVPGVRVTAVGPAPACWLPLLGCYRERGHRGVASTLPHKLQAVRASGLPQLPTCREDEHLSLIVLSPRLSYDRCKSQYSRRRGRLRWAQPAGPLWASIADVVRS